LHKAKRQSEAYLQRAGVVSAKSRAFRRISSNTKFLDDSGKVALFLASDMASHMTGIQVVVDGGVLLS